MNGIQYASRHVHNGENEIGKDLLQISERHRTDHEIHHVTRDLAAWSHEHLRRIAQIAQNYDLDLDEEPETPNRMASQLRGTMSTAIVRRPEPGLLMLEDLQRL